jgi:hypothetical protein
MIIIINHALNDLNTIFSIQTRPIKASDGNPNMEET